MVEVAVADKVEALHRYSACDVRRVVIFFRDLELKSFPHPALDLRCSTQAREGRGRSASIGRLFSRHL